MPSEPPTSPDPREAGSRIRSCSPVCSTSDFCSKLDTAQVESELLETFRESPEFGRSLSERLCRFLEEPHQGFLKFISAGGEASVFGDAERQQVIKLSGPPARSNFGWMIHKDQDGRRSLQPGDLESVLARLALFEALFPTGIAIEGIPEDGSFLLFRQPFIGGTHPREDILHDWMREQGWVHRPDAGDGKTLSSLTWSKGKFIATDVRPENVIQAESNGQLYPIDFIVGAF